MEMKSFMPNDVYELYPQAEKEKRMQELKQSFPFPNSFFMFMPNDVYELYPQAEKEKRMQELKQSFPFPNSFFMDVRCHGCNLVTSPVYSHTQTLVRCADCLMVLCEPTGARATLAELCSFRRIKTDDA